MTPTPINSVTGIESLISFGLQVFLAIWGAFNHPTNPVPVAAAPQMLATIHATPGLTDDHKAVAKVAVDQAVAAYTAKAA